MFPNLSLFKNQPKQVQDINQLTLSVCMVGIKAGKKTCSVSFHLRSWDSPWVTLGSDALLTILIFKWLEDTQVKRGRTRSHTHTAAFISSCAALSPFVNLREPRYLPCSAVELDRRWPLQGEMVMESVGYLKLLSKKTGSQAPRQHPHI